MTFPLEERYGLVSQMRRCSASIPTNIAEGCGRNGKAEFAHFLQVALGSASELDYHLLLSRDLHFLDDETYEPLATEATGVKRMLTVLIQKLRADG